MRGTILTLLFAGLSISASADTVQSFTFVNTTFNSGATAAGTIAIDTTTGAFQNINATITNGPASYTFAGAPVMQGTFDNNSQSYEYSYDGGKDLFVVDLPGASLVNYTGSTLCTFATECGSGYIGYFAYSDNTVDALTSGSLAPSSTAVTPEPSSFILLGTGAIAAFGGMRRRLSAGRGAEATLSKL